MAENSLSKVNVNLPALTNPEAMREIIAVNMEGFEGNMEFPRIKVPAGGTNMFTYVDAETGEEKNSKDLLGPILDHTPSRGYWPAKFNGGNEPPQCVSADGKTGAATDNAILPDGTPLPWAGGTRSCESCPLNQYGSAMEGNGKACKEMHNLFMLLPGTVLPTRVVAPPTSIKPIRNYFTQLAQAMRVPWSVITRLSLVTAKSGQGISYSQISASRAGNLTDEQTRTLSSLRTQFLPMTRSVGVLADDYMDEQIVPTTASEASSPQAAPVAAAPKGGAVPADEEDF